MKKFKILMCRKCGNIQVTSSQKMLKCVYCGKSSVIFSKKRGLITKVYSTFDTGTEASKFIIEFKNKIIGGKE